MAAYTSKAPGDFNADGQTTWNEAGHPDGADDTATITHAITSSAGITSGAIVVGEGGSLDTGTAAATITSITTSGNGVVTIGSGGCTFAGVLNNAGTGTLTISGACTGVTTFTTSVCAMNANVTCTSFVVDASETLTIGGTATLAFTLGSTINGALIMGAGTTLDMTANSSIAVSGNNGASITINGTSWSAGEFCTIKASNAGSTAVLILADIPVWVASFVDVTKATITNTSIPHAGSRFNNLNQDGSNKATRGFLTAQSNNRIAIRNSCICGNTSAGIAANGIWNLKNVLFGRDRANNAKANGADLAPNNANVFVCESVYSTQFSGSLGIVTIDGVYATGAGTTEYGTRGTAIKKDLYLGEVKRDTTNPPSGKTYHARLTPVATTPTSGLFLTMGVRVPVASGDNISVTAQAYRSALSADCADCTIDPHGEWFTPTTVAWNLASDTTYTALPTCAATNAGGTGAVGTVLVEFRLLEYEPAKFLDIGDVTITCGGVEYTVDFSNWSQGIPQAIRAAAGGGGIPQGIQAIEMGITA